MLENFRANILKALAKEDTLLPMMFRGLRKLCCGHEMFLNKVRNIFCVPYTNLCLQQNNVVHVGKRGNICVGNNVSATMCPRSPGPLVT